MEGRWYLPDGSSTCQYSTPISIYHDIFLSKCCLFIYHFISYQHCAITVTTALLTQRGRSTYTPLIPFSLVTLSAIQSKDYGLTWSRPLCLKVKGKIMIINEKEKKIREGKREFTSSLVQNYSCFCLLLSIILIC